MKKILITIGAALIIIIITISYQSNDSITNDLVKLAKKEIFSIVNEN